MIRQVLLLFFVLVLGGCAKKVEPERVRYDANTTVVYSLDTNYTVTFPQAIPINNIESVVRNDEMLDLLNSVKVLILKNKKRDAIIYSLEEKEKLCL